MNDPLFRVWSGPQFEALLIRDVAHRSSLCPQCKDQVTAGLIQRLNELNMLAALEGLTLGPTSPALQDARYWQTLPDQNVNTPSEDTRIMCEKEGRRIAVDGAPILWALKQTPGYQELKSRWAVGAVKYKILYALEGVIEAAGMRQVYDYLPKPYGVRDQLGLYANFTQMHRERYQAFACQVRQRMDADGTYIYPCECPDLIGAHQHIQTWYRTWVDNNGDFPLAAEVIWALHHIQTRITGSVNAWSPAGSDVGWVCWVHDRTQFDDSRAEGVSIAVPMVRAMMRGKGFDLWLYTQAETVGVEVGQVERMIGQASASAQAMEAGLLQNRLCPDMQALSMMVVDDEECY